MAARKSPTPTKTAARTTPTFDARIRISLKKGVTDPEGDNTLKALRLLGFRSFEHVSTERIIHITVQAKTRAEAAAEAEKACKRLLTNPIIHDYRVDVEGSA